MDKPEIAIIGAGPSGISAALQLNKFGIKPLIFDRDEFGSLLNNAYRVDNYPGFPGGISGRKLMKKFNSQFRKTGFGIVRELVIRIIYKHKFIISTNTQIYKSDYLICASGTIPVKDETLIVPKEAANKIIFDVKNLFKMKNKEFAIIGAGDAAFDYALSLATNNYVRIFTRTNEISCNQQLLDEVVSKGNIKIYHEFIIRNITDSKKTLDLTFDNKGQYRQFNSDYLIFAIGRKPNLEYLNIDDAGKTDLINKQKLYIIGDAANNNYRQTGICVGDGLKAAMMIYNKIRTTI